MGKKLFISSSALLLMVTSFLLLSATKDNTPKSFDVKALDKSLCYIPMGSYAFEDSSELFDKIKPRIVTIAAFYMCNHVVSNSEYHIFLNDLKTTHPELYSKMYPDTLVWTSKLTFMQDMVANYFSQPAHANYPVVGISHEQAEYYCKWLTEKYAKYPNRKYKNAVFKLPKLYQWDWAAKGGNADSPFPWGGPYVRNAKGQFLADFIHVPETVVKRDNDTGNLELTYIGRKDRVTNNYYDPADITSPVISYWPNDYGLYNMAGNVAEYISEVGIAKGGDWADPGYYIQIWAEEHYKDAQSASDKIGFRVAMEVEK